MNKYSTIISIIFFMGTLSLPAGETIVDFPSESSKNSISISVGTDFSLVTLKVGYSRAFHLSGINRNLVLDTGFSLPLLKPDLEDFRFNAGVGMDIVKYGSFAVPASISLIVRGTSNDAYNAVGFGTEIGIAPGYYSDLFFIAPEFTWDAQWLTHISYSDMYRDVVHNDAVEGWYGNSADTLRLGARAGVLIKEKIELLVRGGYEFHGVYDFKAPPFYAFLGSNYRF